MLMNGELVLAQLKQSSYERLFLQGEAAQVLARPGVETDLIAIMTTKEVEAKYRVLAHELLIQARWPIYPELADLYCQSLPAGFAHNWWGMPGQYLERLGLTLIEFGQAAIPCLKQLLGDQRALGYSGSEEPTLSQKMHYRVCDLAAYLIANIDRIPYEEMSRVAARDRFIARLLQSLS